MTKDEFVKKYKVGDKIRMYHWNEKCFTEILHFGGYSFFSRSEDGLEYIYPYYQYDWLPYTEPKKIVKMAQAVYNYKTIDETITTFLLSNSLYKSKEEAIAVLGQDAQWPLVVNGIEQWIEVEE